MAPPKSKVDLYAAIRRDAPAGMSYRVLMREHGVKFRTQGDLGVGVAGGPSTSRRKSCACGRKTDARPSAISLLSTGPMTPRPP